jgi:hypothetical protein
MSDKVLNPSLSTFLQEIEGFYSISIYAEETLTDYQIEWGDFREFLKNKFQLDKIQEDVVRVGLGGGDSFKDIYEEIFA